jgi:hypothetical protein
MEKYKTKGKNKTVNKKDWYELRNAYNDYEIIRILDINFGYNS